MPSRETVDRYRGRIARRAEALAAGGRRVQIMEVCGTHTMSIARGGLRSLLPASLRLVSGPGCPVCVTDQAYIDRAVHLARQDGVVIATYGDMVRVPGRLGSLAEARARGARVEVVYSAAQAVELAGRAAGRTVVFLAVGFETTTPGTALAIRRAADEGVDNFRVLTAHKLILPAMRALLQSPDVQIDAFLCPGHVSVILGWRAYEEIVRDFAAPCVVAGFDGGQVLAGIDEILRQLVEQQPAAATVYSSVSPEGNPTALRLMEEMFAPGAATWRGLGTIPQSGPELRQPWAGFDAAGQFDLPETTGCEPSGCRCGDVICGRCVPADCGLFGTRCTPREPVGPCMVSSEGACAAAYKYERPRT